MVGSSAGLGCTRADCHSRSPQTLTPPAWGMSRRRSPAIDPIYFAILTRTHRAHFNNGSTPRAFRQILTALRAWFRIRRVTLRAASLMAHRRSASTSHFSRIFILAREARFCNFARSSSISSTSQTSAACRDQRRPQTSARLSAYAIRARSSWARSCIFSSREHQLESKCPRPRRGHFLIR